MNDVQHEAYRPVIEDGWGIFPEDLRVSKLRADPAKPSRRRLNADSHQSEWIRQSLLRAPEADGVRLRRGMVELAEAS